MNVDNLESGNSVSRDLYTGLATIQIQLVNPTKNEIVAFLATEDDKVKDPNYLISKDDKPDTYRLDFWYVNHNTFGTPLKGKFSLFVGLDDRDVSSTGKYQWIDDHANVVWGENIDAIKEADKSKSFEVYTDYASLRRAKIGEEDLYKLLKAYGNVDTRKSKFRLDDFAKAVTNKSNELQKYFKDFNDKKNRGLKVLLTIRDGQYQSVWTRDFLPLEATQYKYLEKSVRNDQYGCKDYFADSLRFTKFTGEMFEPAPTSKVNIDFGAPPSSAPAAAPAVNPEDLF